MNRAVGGRKDAHAGDAALVLEWLDAELRDYVRARVADSGVEVTELGVKDVILPGEIRELVNKVVEAERVINMNHEKQTILLRGVVRRGDIGANNTVASDSVGDLELEIKGKGVISDGVRPPLKGTTAETSSLVSGPTMNAAPSAIACL